ncbi:sulfite exporter TauE/SafE family protein [Chloroflexota bacterium]
MSGAEIVLLAVTGFLAGIFGTMIGIGGGIIFVPVFLLFFHFSPQQAVGTSLCAVFFNALSGSISYLRQKRVDIKAGWKFALATLPGVWLGAWLSGYFTPRILGLAFTFLLIAVSIFIFLRVEPHQKDKGRERNTRTLVDFRSEVFRYSPREGTGIVISFFVGIISSLMGIGGGIIRVPALIFLLGFPVHIATATSHFVLAISTFSGSVFHFLLGNILILPAVVVAASAIPGAQLGAALSRRVKSRLIMRLLAAVLLLVAIRLLLKFTEVY